MCTYFVNHARWWVWTSLICSGDPRNTFIKHDFAKDEMMCMRSAALPTWGVSLIHWLTSTTHLTRGTPHCHGAGSECGFKHSSSGTLIVTVSRQRSNRRIICIGWARRLYSFHTDVRRPILNYFLFQVPSERLSRRPGHSGRGGVWGTPPKENHANTHTPSIYRLNIWKFGNSTKYVIELPGSIQAPHKKGIFQGDLYVNVFRCL